MAVGDQPVVSLRLPGNGSWINPAQVRLTVDLPTGDSAIRLFHPDRPVPDLDQIVVH